MKEILITITQDNHSKNYRVFYSFDGKYHNVHIPAIDVYFSIINESKIEPRAKAMILAHNKTKQENGKINNH